jgi:hypothetical protein
MSIRCLLSTLIILCQALGMARQLCGVLVVKRKCRSSLNISMQFLSFITPLLIWWYRGRKIRRSIFGRGRMARKSSEFKMPIPISSEKSLPLTKLDLLPAPMMRPSNYGLLILRKFKLSLATLLSCLRSSQ